MPIKFPSLYLLEDNIPSKKLEQLEREIGDSLSTHIQHAELIIAHLDFQYWRRARMLLHGKLKEFSLETEAIFHSRRSQNEEDIIRAPKRTKLSVDDEAERRDIIVVDSPTEISGDERVEKVKNDMAWSQKKPLTPDRYSAVASVNTGGRRTYKVVKLEWYYDSLKAEHLLPTADYSLYEGREKGKESKGQTITTLLPPARTPMTIPRPQAETPLRDQSSQYKHRRFRNSGSQMNNPPALRPETTSDIEEARNMPPLPSFLASDYVFKTSSCHRPTPLVTPNDTFIAQLKLVREARELKPNRVEGGSPKGLSYAKAIASIASYPYTISSSLELARLPNCGSSTLALYSEWKEHGHCQEVDRIEADEEIQCLKLFASIHDVGADRARAFYAKGWRDLNDCIMHWDTLTQNQQIGVKYYDDFNEKIPREEVRRIASIVLKYANKIHAGFQMVICGGFRRGKPMSGDVDVVLTHPNERVTQDFLPQLVNELHADDWVKHQLSLTTNNSNRGQEAARKHVKRKSGGFGSLDQSFVVWQDAELAKNPQPDKPNPKRRVDIIISPWKTAGCAVLGWTGQTQFERDLRTYCDKKLGLRFDSSGIITQAEGIWQDFEGDETDLLEKEKKVFAGIQLEWREPTERCTG